MSFLDKAKSLAGKHSEQVKAGIDKAEDVADKATKGKYTEQIDSAGDKAASYLETLDDKYPAEVRLRSSVDRAPPS